MCKIIYKVIFGSVAQSAEQEPFKLKVVGSIPTRPTYTPFIFDLNKENGVLIIIFKSRYSDQLSIYSMSYLYQVEKSGVFRSLI